MLRTSRGHFQKFLLSPLEGKFAEFTGSFVEFVETRKPDIVSINDVVYLGSMLGRSGISPENLTHLELAAHSIELALVPDGPLSVAISVGGTFPKFLERAKRQFSERDLTKMTPRHVLRVLPFMEDELREKISSKDFFSNSLDFSELSNSDLVMCIRFTGHRIDRTLLHRIPFMTLPEVSQLLLEVVSLSPSEFTHEIVSASKLRVLSGAVELNIRAIVALGRIGALDDRARSLLGSTKRTKFSDRDLVMIANSLYCLPAKEESICLNLEKFSGLKDVEADLVRVVESEESEPDLRVLAAYALVAKRGGTDGIESFIEFFSQSDIAGIPFDIRLRLVELIVLAGGDTSQPVIAQTLAEEKELLLSDPVVTDVMTQFACDSFAPMDTLPFPVLFANEIAFDIDSYSNACNRRVRALTAQKNGIKYKVIDSLSWRNASDKSTYITELMEADSYTLCNSATQMGADMVRVDPGEEQPRKPYFAYVRKNDLK
jgi:hypothetical protein